MPEEFTTPDLVELTRRSYQYASAREWDALMSLYGPDAIFDLTAVGLGTYEGPAAIRGFFEEWGNGYDEYQVDAEEVLDFGNGVVFAVATIRGRPVDSTAYVQLHYAGVTLWNGGVAVRLTNHNDIDEARAAAERLAEERG
jgi:ketosteroid isomerase-like protein